MVHDAMVLEYSGRNLALIEAARMLKLLVFVSLVFALFAPWGIADAEDGIDLVEILAGIAFFGLHLLAAATAIAVLELVVARMRVFRVVEFLGAAFILAASNSLVFALMGNLQDEYGFTDAGLGFIAAAAFLMSFMMMVLVAPFAAYGAWTLTAAQAALTAPTVEKAVAYSRDVMEISSETQRELAHAVIPQFQVSEPRLHMRAHEVFQAR